MSVSEVARAGLRKLEEEDIKLQALRAKLQAGEESPVVEGFDDERFLASIRQNIANEAKLLHHATITLSIF